MKLASLGFLAGVLASQTLAVLPQKEWSLLIIVLFPLVFRFPAFRVVLCILLGFLYSVFIAHDKLAGQISPALEGQDLLITGTVASVPDANAQRSRFLFDVSDLSEFPVKNKNSSTQIIKNGTIPKRLRLAWYRNAAEIHAGQRWQLVVRLKHPRGFSNPGGFDYEAWLYQQGIHATGYVRGNSTTKKYNKLLGHNDQWFYEIHRFRGYLVSQIHEALPNSGYRGLITALLVGHRQDITKSQWSVLTATGTNHLMAISGLHIGLVAGMIYWLAGLIWRRIPRAVLYLSAPRAAAGCALLAAVIYAALAGFTLPTQRAVIMISIVMFAIWSQRDVNPSQILSLALLAVLLYDPTSVISGSFWLSFGAVALIFYTMVGRLQVKNWWWKWGRVQWVTAVGLFPVLLYWFQQVPLLSPVANFIAVPLVSFVTVPLTLCSGVFLLIWPGLAHGLLTAAAGSLQLLWPLLQGLAAADRLLWYSSQPPVWTLLPALLGIAWLLAPKGMPARWLGIFWLLPLALFPREEIDSGTVKLTILDVGHGLASVVQTRNHVLVYDAGPRYSAGFDAGDAVVVPFLRWEGIESIDRLILSHDDVDHIGGYQSIARQIAIADTMMSSNVQLPDRGREGDSHLCLAGGSWTWDGVLFRILHPKNGFQDERDNNMSCVVQITTQTDKILLTGDIERRVETELVKYFAPDDDNLRAGVLVVPHHGSRSSSSETFLQAVKPDYAVISVGYKNRYGLPKAEVLQRYRDIGARIMQTSSLGAITLMVGAEKGVRFASHREYSRRYWSNGNH